MVKHYITFFNTIDNRWKVVDIPGFIFGDGATEKQAVESALCLGISLEDIDTDVVI